MQIDECLIAQAQMKATGAVIHDLANVISAYRLCANLNGPEHEARCQRLEAKLRKFIYTGELKHESK